METVVDFLLDSAMGNGLLPRSASTGNCISVQAHGGEVGLLVDPGLGFGLHPSTGFGGIPRRFLRKGYHQVDLKLLRILILYVFRIGSLQPRAADREASLALA